LRDLRSRGEGFWREYTFGEVLGYVRKIAEYLKEKGIKRGTSLPSFRRIGTVIPLDARLTDVERRLKRS
jgi:hypothetical protein